eukprot:TRINITY_DN6092_c0_g2_i1.p1 TRINITY_DN6092_c0_g2~~TRINITY_DN6092_c0_g2_i1.p1  ORF type:complete len:182 (-),score=24.42 TRINITY_DN6092_c0_g2_i1:83-628(-)
MGAVWAVGTVIRARLTNILSGLTSFVRILGVVVVNPAAEPTGLVYAADPQFYPITGSNFGTGPSSSEVISVNFNGMDCRSVTWISPSRLDCVGLFPAAVVSLEVTMLGGYSFTVANYLTIADAKNVDVGSDYASYIRGVATTIELVADVRPFNVSDIPAALYVNEHSSACGSLSIHVQGQL